jgi:alkylation response protein AidB-like acyl-CoA dehydrogenase
LLCQLPRSDDIVSFRRNGATGSVGSYTAVYLGIAVAAHTAIVEIVRGPTPPGFAQPLAYHPDVRRRVAGMSVDLETTRLLTYHSAWLSDAEGPTPAALSALYRAKYFVGEAVTRITRTAVSLGGAHALFKTGSLEHCSATVRWPRYSFAGATLPGEPRPARARARSA